MKHARNDGPDIAFRLGRRVVSAVADDMSTTQRVVVGAVAALVAISPFGAWSKVEAQADPFVTGAPVEVGPFEVTVVKASTADELAYLVPAEGNHLLAVVADVTNTGEVPELSSTLGQAIPAPQDAGIVPQVPYDLLGTGTTTNGTGADAGTPSVAPPATIDAGTTSDTPAATDAGTTSDTPPATETGTTSDAASSSDLSASADPGESDGTAVPGESDDSGETAQPEKPRLPPATIFNVEDATTLSILNPGLTYRVALVWEQSGDWSEQAVPLEMVELEWVEEDPQGLDDGHWFANEVAFQGQVPVNAARAETGTQPEDDTEAGQR